MMMRIALFLIAACALGFLIGTWNAVRIHGDWIVERNGLGCVAFDPNKGENAGQWPIDRNGRCHIADFIWHDLGALSLGGLR